MLKIPRILVAVSLCLTCSQSRADTFGSDPNTMFEIEFVVIGDPNNPDDTGGAPDPAGKVEYVFRMGKFEISEDMIAKANAQSAADGNPLNISYHSFGAGIDKPATGITWYEAAQFVNWLNTSNGYTPAYKFSGSTFELWDTGDTGYNPNNRFRNRRARYVLPSVDEWYKAAYYDPTVDAYYDYPTGSDNLPDGIDFAGDLNFEAVYFDGGANPVPNAISDVGVLSPYGTGGQGGNVWEWEESEYDLVNNSTSSPRGVRGGAWNETPQGLPAASRNVVSPTSENDNRGIPIGFRVASIPEPSTCILALAALCLPFRRYR